MNKILIRLDEEQRAALDTLSAQSGHPVAALVRWCVNKSLPTLASNVAAQVKVVPNQSTIDVKPTS